MILYHRTHILCYILFDSIILDFKWVDVTNLLYGTEHTSDERSKGLLVWGTHTCSMADANWRVTLTIPRLCAYNLKTDPFIFICNRHRYKILFIYKNIPKKFKNVQNSLQYRCKQSNKNVEKKLGIPYPYI